MLKKLLLELVATLSLLRPGMLANRPRMAAHLMVPLPYLGVQRLVESKHKQQVAPERSDAICTDSHTSQSGELKRGTAQNRLAR